ncbi:MAG: ParB-like nuclease domain-containing protein [Phycisphaerales bacterium]|nr:ParB-like nuclease domain-containing protein [Phycisphaerales bacterium]
MAKKRDKKTTPPNIPKDAVDIPVEKLLLDPQNPRLVEHGVEEGASQATLVRSLWTMMAVQEVALSIAHNGFFRHEPLIVEKRAEKYVVLEGNRRLAAVRILLDDELRQRLKATDLPNIDRTRRKSLATLPCVVTTRRDVWQYLGFKHVNGPATWGSYSKAQYVAQIHNEYGVPLDDIAEQIGDTHSTVERMYRGLMVIEQAEAAKVFSRDNSYRKFGFSHIYTGLDKLGIQQFLGISDKKRSDRRPVPLSKLRHLGELCGWLYGDKSQDIAPVMQSQNPDLGILDSVLLSPKGVQSLRDGLPLAVSRDAALGDRQLFRGAIHESKQALQRAHATLSTGFDPKDTDMMSLAREIEGLAGDLTKEMEAKRKVSRRQEG